MSNQSNKQEEQHSNISFLDWQLGEVKARPLVTGPPLPAAWDVKREQTEKYPPVGKLFPVTASFHKIEYLTS